MANNRTYVSPGVYTSETDLTYVSQSTGISSLGMVGETLRGPAFEPILIKNFDDYKTIFGGTSPEKNGNGDVKYPLGYFIKSYLEYSNQAYITRILGLTGYKAGKSYGIKTLGGIKVDTTTVLSATTETLSGQTNSITGSTSYSFLSGKTAIDGSTIPTFISNLTVSDGAWFTIGYVPSSGTSALNTSLQLDSPIGNEINKNWYNEYFIQTGQNITGVASFLFKYSGSASGYTITKYTIKGELNQDYDDVIVLNLRSRGNYVSNTLKFEVTGNTAVQISGSNIDSNPLSDFTLSVTKSDGNIVSYTANLDRNSTKYISKVLGSDVFGKNTSEYPIFVSEVYPNLVSQLFSQGLIRGLSETEVVVDEGDNFSTQWDTSASPFIVSEVRGGKVSDLFQVITISDGNMANKLIKISIQNIDIENGTFDLLVRDYNDTDDNMVILEKYQRCTLDPETTGFLGAKVGTSDGEYQLVSKYIMINFADEYPIDAIPSGFRGYTTYQSGTGSSKTLLGTIKFKTKYYDAGDVISENIDGSQNITQGDKVRKVSLGISSQIGFDGDMLNFKGKNVAGSTTGFHLSSNASTIVDTNGDKLFQTTDYDFEGQTGENNKLVDINYRKFTLAVAGGFDGWDIYRKNRTNTDDYILGKKIYNLNTTNNGGLFSTTTGNSDYYAYLQGIQTFSNPEDINITVFATPGIDFLNNASLVNETIDMIENDRADSLYIIDSPSPNFVSTTGDLVGALDYSDIDSNYSATYWPWIQVKDTDNGVQLYLPPTGEVLKNIAYTDKVSFPWFSVAGYNRGIVSSIKAHKKLNASDKDDLYKNRVNPIASFTDIGTLIFGNKTLQKRESSLNRINVRRLFLRARKLVSSVAIRLVFDQDDDQVRNDFLKMVNPILDNIRKERGLTDFRVVVSNSAEDIDANTLRGKIYLKPTRALEYIELDFVATPTGASFDNI
jgi:hypothetical protein